MVESEYTKTIYDLFVNEFPNGWIDDLSWKGTDEDKVILVPEMNKIERFIDKLFIEYGKLVLSGDQFKSETKLLGEISNKLMSEAFPLEENKYKSMLMENFISLQNNVKDAENIVKYHISLTKEKFEHSKKDYYFNAIRYVDSDDSRDSRIELLNLVCHVIWNEYLFSYNELYIKNLYTEYLDLKEYLKKYSGSKDIRFVVECAIEKVVFLLKKLSYFSDKKEIKFNCDFEEETFDINSKEYPDGDFRSYYLKYIDTEKIKESEVKEWQNNLRKDNVPMWNIALLTRYYIKKECSVELIDDLIKLEEKQYQDSIKTDENIINLYSDESFRNYMFNSRFSYLSQFDKDYSFGSMKKDLEKIETIQNKTFIFDYHPYQKAIEFIITFLERKISNLNKGEDLLTYMDFLKKCYEKFKKNIDWCKRNQSYYIQMRYKFSTIKKDDSFSVFYPSSFCRPLKYNMLDEFIVQFNTKISFLEYQVNHIEDRYQLMEAQDKIGAMEEKNIKNMGLFMSVMTFLVGILSIFIGNGRDVSIFSKMQYVIALGVILLLFVCLGYLLVERKLLKVKAFIFGIISAACTISLVIILYGCFNNSPNHKIKQQSSTIKAISKKSLY